MLRNNRTSLLRNRRQLNRVILPARLNLLQRSNDLRLRMPASAHSLFPFPLTQNPKTKPNWTDLGGQVFQWLPGSRVFGQIRNGCMLGDLALSPMGRSPVTGIQSNTIERFST